MNKYYIKTFFNSLAPKWDENQKSNKDVIDFILDKSEVKEGTRVLDVASGTGVLFDYYLKRKVGCLIGIDISDEMLKIAKDKFPQVELICADAEDFDFQENFDVVMIYNAFPHFPNPEKLFLNLSSALSKGGRLTVAHGLSEKELEKCHASVPAGVSAPLPSKDKTAEMMSQLFFIDVMISDDEKYIVSGVKK